MHESGDATAATRRLSHESDATARASPLARLPARILAALTTSSISSSVTAVAPSAIAAAPPSPPPPPSPPIIKTHPLHTPRTLWIFLASVETDANRTRAFATTLLADAEYFELGHIGWQVDVHVQWSARRKDNGGCTTEAPISSRLCQLVPTHPADGRRRLHA